jgi:Uma2 family endonuclease
MSDPVAALMTSDEFIAWAMEQPKGKRYELFAGKVVGMAPERSAHALAKFRVARRLEEAVERDGLPCTVYPDGMAVVIDETTTYEPDALVRCGPEVPPDTVKLTDPVIVVEVLSQSTRARDHGDKLIDYFRLASVRHYLIVRPEDGVIHHAWNADGSVLTRIVREGDLVLDQPGLTVTGLFPMTGGVVS